MNSLTESSSMFIDYINHEVSQKITVISNLKIQQNVHPNIFLYLFVILLIIGLIVASVYMVKNRSNICPYKNYMKIRQLQQVPTATNELYNLNAPKST